jgi:hypothetical protein
VGSVKIAGGVRLYPQADFLGPLDRGQVLLFILQKLLYAVAALGGTTSPAFLHADWHAMLMGRDRLVSSVFTSPGTWNDVSCLPTVVRFRRVLSMHIPETGHGFATVESARHTPIPNDSGA